MVEVGSISLTASLDDTELQIGIQNIETGMNRVHEKTNMINSDFKRLGLAGAAIAKTFALMGVAGAGAMVAIAKGAPGTAGAMAQMKVDAQELGFALGEAMGPAFEDAADLFGEFVSFIRENKDVIGAFADAIVDAARKAATALKGMATEFKESVEEEEPEINIPGKAGIAGVAGALAPGGLFGKIATAAVTYGSLDALERTMEFAASSEDAATAGVKAFAPKFIQPLYLWLIEALGINKMEVFQKDYVYNQPDGVDE